MGKGIVKLGEGKWAVKDGNLLAAKETNGRFKNAEFTVTRGTDATYVGRDGLIVNETGDDTPRIDFTDNTDGHLLLEPQSTNLIPYSEDFSQWELGSNATLSYESDVVAPDGSLGVYRLTLPAQSGTFIYLTDSNSNQRTCSVYAKSASVNDEGFNILLNLGSSKFSTNNEWQRFEFTDTGSGNVSFINSGDTFVTDIYIWGAQLEELPYPTSYIPTNGSTVTRDAETCTGAGETADFNSEEGVLYAEIAALADDLTDRDISLSDGTNNNVVRIRLSRFSNNIGYYVLSNGVTNVGALVSGQTQTNTNKIAVKYKQNDFALWINGVEVATDTSGNTPIGLGTLQFTSGNIALPFYGKCKAIRVYKEALSDSELTTLTS